MVSDMWASLPSDLLVEVLRHLATTAVVRCAGACRAWRRIIIDNASSLRPRPDRFNPNLLIGFFYRYCRSSSYHARLHYVPGAMGAAADTPPDKQISFFIPLSAAGGVNVAQYDQPLSSRDGLLLLGGGSESNLCLCNPLAGTCRFIPTTALGAFETCTYELVTGDDSAAVWVLALRREEDVKRGVMYQIFSSVSGEWGAVKRSAKFEKAVARADMTVSDLRYHTVVCRGSICFLVKLFSHHRCRRPPRWCMFSIDVRTERTWTTELPKKRKMQDTSPTFNRLIVATSEDDRLSLIVERVRDTRIEMWVLTCNGEWVLQRAIDMDSFIPKDGRSGS